MKKEETPRKGAIDERRGKDEERMEGKRKDGRLGEKKGKGGNILP